MTGQVQANPRRALFAVLVDTWAAMPGVVGLDEHLWPMTQFVDHDAGTLWFTASKNTELVREIGLRVQAHHCVMSADGTRHACLTGTLE